MLSKKYRNLIFTFFIIFSLGICTNSLPSKIFAGEPHAELAKFSPEEALERLLEGHKRFLACEPAIKDFKKAIANTAQIQHPNAVIVTCSDSRVPPEILFDSNIGEIFVIRVAGNIMDPYTIGSVEYAVQHLGTRLIVILGHAKCGAVNSALCKLREGNITYLMNKIEPGIKEIIKDSTMSEGEKLTSAIKKNIKYQISQMLGYSQVIQEKFKSGELKIAGMYYDVGTGNLSMEPLQ
ncbi:MAG: carbonic anhydrase [Candidatus Riflebacteria bacterium]|nr:carbonic anhydrase [Candidatus Riflebacteria bacterium]